MSDWLTVYYGTCFDVGGMLGAREALSALDCVKHSLREAQCPCSGPDMAPPLWNVVSDSGCSLPS